MDSKTQDDAIVRINVALNNAYPHSNVTLQVVDVRTILEALHETRALLNQVVPVPEWARNMHTDKGTQP